MLLELEGVLPPDALARARGLIEGAKFVSGGGTARGAAASVKNNLQLPGTEDGAAEASRLVLDHVSAHPLFRAAAWACAVTAPRFCRYETGMYYGEHLDAPLMADETLRTDIAVTVFLNDASDYDGGELVIETDYGVQRFKKNAGDCLLYPANTRHRIAPVTRGARLVCIFWVESLVRDPARRKILFDLACVLEYLDREHEPAPFVEVLRRCQLNLVRLWAKT